MPGSPVSGGHQPFAVCTADGRVLLLAIGENDELSLFTPVGSGGAAPGSHLGWARTPITAFGEDAHFDTLAAYLRPDGALAVAVALTRPGQRGLVYVTDDFNVDDPSKTVWQPRGASPSGFHVKQLLFGRFFKPDEELLIAYTSDGAVIRISPPDGWHVLSHRIREARDLQPAWSEWDGKMQPALMCHTSSDIHWLNIDRPGGRSVPASGVSAVAAAGTPAAPTRHYIAQKRQVYLRSDDGPGTPVGQELPGEVTQLMVRDAAGEQCVMACAAGKLWLLWDSGPGNWYCVASDVAQVACASTPVDHPRSFQIFISGDDNLAVLWRDRHARMFKRAEVVLPHTDRAHRVLTSTTRVHLLDPNGDALRKKSLTLELSESCYIEVNALSFFGERGRVYPVETDADGNLTIVKHISGLAMPRLRLRAKDVDDVLDINPMTHLGHALETESRKDLDNLWIGEGERRRKLTDQVGRGAATAQMIGKTAEYLKSVESAEHSDQATQAAQEGVAVHPKGAPLVPEVPAAALSGRACWSVIISAEGATFHDDAETRALLASRSDSAEALDIVTDVGSFLAHLYHVVKDVTAIIVTEVEKGLEMFFEGVGTILVKTMEEVLDSVKAALQVVLGIDLDKIVQWLGFLFNWQDIVHTHTVMAETLSRTLRDLKGSLPEVRQKVQDYLAGLHAKIQDIRLPDAISSLNLNVLARDHARHGGVPSHEGDFTPMKAQFVMHPGANWASAALARQPAPSGTAPHVDEPIFGKLKDFMDALTPHAGPMQDYFKGNHASLEEKLRSDDLTLGDLFETLVRPLLNASEALITALANASVDVLEALFACVEKLWTAELELPLFSALWRDVLRMEAPFTFANAILLLAAVPMTVLCKVITGKAPFPSTLSADDDGFLRGWEVWAAGVGALVLRTLTTLLRGAWVDLLPHTTWFLLGMDAVCLGLWFPPFSRPLPENEAILAAFSWGTWAVETAASFAATLLGQIMKLAPEVGAAAGLVVTIAFRQVILIEEVLLVSLQLSRGLNPWKLATMIARCVQLAYVGPIESSSRSLVIAMNKVPPVAGVALAMYYVALGLRYTLHAGRVVVGVLEDQKIIESEPSLA